MLTRAKMAGAHPGFLRLRMKHAWEYCYSYLDGMLVHRRVTPQYYVAGTHLYIWAQLFEGRLALNTGLNLTRVSFSLVQKDFLAYFSLLF